MVSHTHPKKKQDPWRQLWPFLKPYWGKMLVAFISLCVASIAVLVFGTGIKLLVDSGFTEKSLLDLALIIMLVMIGVIAAATYGRFYLVSWIGERVVADMRRAIFDRLVHLGPTFFEVTRVGELMSRMTADTTIVQSVIGSSASVALRNFLLALGGTVALFVTSPKLTILVFMVVPLVIIPIVVLGRRVRELSGKSQDSLADLAAFVDETMRGIQTVQAFNREEWEKGRFKEHAEHTFDTGVSRIKMRAILTVLVIILVFSAVAVILWIGGHDVLKADLTHGQLAAFVFYAIIVAGSIGALSEIIGDLNRAAGAIDRLTELLNTFPQIKRPQNPTHLPAKAEGRIVANRVNFSYPSRPDIQALQDISFAIEPGETVALVGPSGAGKTTLFQMLLRFYDPQKGWISFDGINLAEADPAELRRHIGIVSQEPVIFSSTVRNNIKYGKPDASEDEIEAAARAAHAIEFINKLPEGMDTHLGQRGIRLSGGQRQRIAIARALLCNPPLLLLDEATSALDSHSERVIQRALTRLMKNRTTLVIAHRLSTVQNADRIIVMDHGKIVSLGTHDELVEQGGLYAKLSELQFDFPSDKDELDAV